MRHKIAIVLLSLALPLAACESKEDIEGVAPHTEQELAEKAKKAAEAAEKTAESSDDEKDEKVAEPKSDQSFAGESEQGNFYVEITPEPNPIPFQELFTLDIRVLDPEDKKTVVEDVSIDQVRADMPAHGHGMKVKPKVTRNDDGSFLVEGMKFHMQGPGKHGLWVIEAVLNDGKTVDKVSYDVQCCAE